MHTLCEVVREVGKYITDPKIWIMQLRSDMKRVLSNPVDDGLLRLFALLALPVAGLVITLIVVGVCCYCQW